MARFFETFNVIEEDGRWTAGSTFDTPGCGFHVRTTDICVPGSPAPLPDTPMGQDPPRFVIVADQIIPTRCDPGDLENYVNSAMKRSSEYMVTKNLWHGAPGYTGPLYLKSTEVTEVPRTGDPYAVLGAVLEKAFEQSPHLDPVVHLGWQAAMSLQLGLSTLGLPYVVPTGYPKDVIAVTGPITVRLGSIKTSSAVDPKLNRKYIQANRLGALEFDPCFAVRAADTV